MSPIPINNELRSSLTKRLQQARGSTDSLFELLDPTAIADRPIRERHRIIFCLGHLEAFDWNLIGKTTLGLDPFHEHFDNLFAFGIDPANGNLPSDTASDWPPLAEIQTYNQRARETVDCFLRETTFDESKDLENGLVFHVAIEHRLMHTETLTYLVHWIPIDRKRPPSQRWQTPENPKVQPRQVEIPAGTATLGLRRDTNGFGWDNEFGPTSMDVSAFLIDAYNVTNQEYLEFVRAGGYDERSFWSDKDWAWKSREGIAHPHFWMWDGKRWMQQNMFDTRPVPLSWPVYVSHAEASAYARWAGKSLPSEAQLHRAAYGTLDGTERPYPWGTEAPRTEHGNFDLCRWNPTPVGSFPAGNSAFGVADLLGNGWEWSLTVFEPFEGFERLHFYPGYSADFFDGNHFVTKGGSSRTSACMLRRSFRNWFQPHYPYIYTTFRTVEA